MFPSVRSRLPSGRCAADRVAASSRQYEAPVMPHNVITSVAAPGSASIQAAPALKPARLLAAPSPPPAPAAAWATTGWVLGEVTARCLPIRTPGLRHYATRRGPAARERGWAGGRG